MLDMNLDWVEVMMLRKVVASQRKRARLLSERIHLLAEDLKDAVSKRDRAFDKAEKLERALAEEFGKVHQIKPRKPGRKSVVAAAEEEKVLMAIKLAQAGKLQEALALMGKV